MAETLEDQLRRDTRNFTAPLSEHRVLELAQELLLALQRAHADTPSRHPELDPKAIAVLDGKPVLEGGGATEGSVSEDLFCLGVLLHRAATGRTPDVSWRLDGPDLSPGRTLLQRAFFAALATPRRERGFRDTGEALRALESARGASEVSAWPLFRGSAERQGTAEGGAAPGGLELLWTATVGSCVASPILIEGLLVAATADGRVVWLDPGTGRLLQELKVASAVESSPCAAGGRLYLGTEDGECVALDLEKGAVAWRARLGQVVRSSPLPLDERVLVGVIEAKGAGGLVALDEKGKPVWKVKLQATFSSPAKAEASVVVGSDDGHLHAIDPSKGATVWAAGLGGKVRGTPAVAGGTVFAGSFAGKLAALKSGDGTPLWSAELGTPLYSSPCVSGALVAVGANDGTLHGLDRANGNVRFAARTRGPIVASPVALGGALVVGSTDGDLYLVDADGALRGQLTLASQGVASSAALAGDRLFVGSALGIHALRLLARA